jgi:phage terminase small subunit
MPRGGHNALPDEVKAKKGTLQPQRVNPSKPKITPAQVPLCDPSMDDAYQTIWNRLKSAVEEMGVYARGDFDSFQAMVSAVYAGQRLPADAMVKDVIAIRKQALECLREFGLTPLARAKVNTLGQKDVETDDPLGEFLQ